LTRTWFAALALTSSACSATVTHSHITSPEADAAATGVRYLGTSPYLIAYSDGKGGVVTEVKYLPDPAKKMSAKPDAKLADVDTKMDFDRGVLTTSVESGDATAVPKAIVKAVETLAPKLLAALNKADTAKEYTVPAPYVFKIVVNGNDVYFLGGQGDAPIKITLLRQDAKQ
jgi:hypothetical protein